MSLQVYFHGHWLICSVYALGPLAQSCEASISFVMSVSLSVRPSATNNAALTRRISMKIYIGDFHENRTTYIRVVEGWDYGKRRTAKKLEVNAHSVQQNPS
jgi:hypothetical protein